MTIFDKPAADDLIRRIESLDDDRKPLWGKMTAGQMLCHVTDGMRMATGELVVADTSNFVTRTVLKPLVLYVLSFPKNVPTLPEIDQLGSGTPVSDFGTDRSNAVAYLNKICSLGGDFGWADHGKFGPLDRKEWGILAHKHLDHHLKQFGV